MHLDLIDLISVRIEMATAEVSDRAGDAEAALAALGAVWPLITANELAHQAWKHNKILERVTGERVPPEYERFAVQRFRLLTPREAALLQLPGFEPGCFSTRLRVPSLASVDWPSGLNCAVASWASGACGFEPAQARHHRDRHRRPLDTCQSIR